MSSHERSVLQAFPFAEGDRRGEGQVEVVHRTTTFDDGNQRVFIDLQIHIGERFLTVPAKHIEGLIAALRAGAERTTEEIEKLPPPPRNDSRPYDRGDRGDRGRRRDGDGYRRR